VPTAPSPQITVNTASVDQSSGVASSLNPQAPPSTYSPTVSISLNDPKNSGDPRVVNWKRGHGLPPLRPQVVRSDNTEEHIPSAIKENTNPNVHDTSADKIDAKDL